MDCTEDTRLSTAGCQHTSNQQMLQTTSTSSRMTNSGFHLTCIFLRRLLQVGRVSQRASKGQTLENAEVGFFYSCRLIQWRRSVVKCVGSWSVKSSHQTVSGDLKNWVYLPFLTLSFILGDVKLAELSNNSFE